MPDTSILSAFEKGILNKDAIAANVFEPITLEFIDLSHRIADKYNISPYDIENLIRNWMLSMIE